MDYAVLIGVGAAGLIVGFLIGLMAGKGRKPSGAPARPVTGAERKPEKKKSKKALKAELAAAAAAALAEKEPWESFDVHVARVDVERHATIGVTHHVDDLLRELQEDGELHHVLRLVVLGYDAEGERLSTVPDLCYHVLQIHEARPCIPVLLDRPSMKVYLRILLAARRTAGVTPPSPDMLPIEALEQEIVGHVTQWVTTAFSNRPELLSKVLDLLVSRLEKVCNQMEEEDLAKQGAAAHGMTPR